MIRKFTVCLMLCLTVLIVSSCNEDAPTPPKSSLSVDSPTGVVGVTKFHFTVTHVNADAITLFPYGTAQAALGSVLIDPAKFVDGKAVVEFVYAKVGAWQAVVQTNNHSGDGKSVKNVQSEPVTVTVTNNLSTLSGFTLTDYDTKGKKNAIKATKTDTLADRRHIQVTMPFGADITKLVASYTVDQAATVSVSGGADTPTDSVRRNFTSPITYTVKSQDGAKTTDYVISVVVTPAETYKGIKTFTGTLQSAAVKGRGVPAYTDSVNNIIVVYDTLGTPTDRFDSVRVKYTLTGAFAAMNYGSVALKQDSLLDLSGAAKQVTVKAQDGTSKVYSIYALQAPKLQLSFQDLTPVVMGVNNNFSITLNVLKQSSKVYATTFNVVPPTGATLVSVKAGNTTISSGDNVDFKKPVTFWVTLHNTALNIDYSVAYTASIKELP